MPSVKAIYEDGQVVFPKGSTPEGRMEVVVLFPEQGQSAPSRGKDKDAGKRFVRKWAGVLAGCDIGDWKDQKAEYLKGKPGESPS